MKASDLINAARSETEQIILATMLRDSPPFDSIKKVKSSTTVEDFILPNHKTLYQAMSSLSSTSSAPITIESVGRAINQEMADGTYNKTIIPTLLLVYAESKNGRSSPEFLDGLCSKLKSFRVPETISKALEDAREANAQGKDPKAILGLLQAQLGDIKPGEDAKPYQSCFEVGNDLLLEVEGLWTGKTTGRIIPTMWPQLNKRLGGGWCRKTINTIAARPSTGKSALWEQDMAHAMKRGHGVLCIPLEMDSVYTLTRMVQREYYDTLDQIGSLGFWNRRLPKRRQDTVRDCVVEFLTNPITFIDISSPQIDVLLGKCEAAIQDAPNGHYSFLVIDYLQLAMDSSSKQKNRNLELASIMGKYKAFCFRHNLAGINICQLNRGLEKEHRLPRKSDICDSGSIENLSTNILFPYRPSMAGHSQEHKDIDDEAKFVVDKARGGSPGIIDVTFNGPRMSFLEREEADKSVKYNIQAMELAALEKKHG